MSKKENNSFRLWNWDTFIVDDQRLKIAENADTDSSDEASISQADPADPVVGLSPPWFTYHRELIHSIGTDPSIEVGPLVECPDCSDNPQVYNVIITVQNRVKAQAVADILNPVKEFSEGAILVKVSVYDAEGNLHVPECPGDNAYAVVDTLNIALKDTAYFKATMVRPFAPGSPELAIYPLFEPAVIQFYNDDLSNFCQFYVNVASQVFADVMLPVICADEETSFPIYPSTDCIL